VRHRVRRPRHEVLGSGRPVRATCTVKMKEADTSHRPASSAGAPAAHREALGLGDHPAASQNVEITVEARRSEDSHCQSYSSIAKCSARWLRSCWYQGDRLIGQEGRRHRRDQGRHNHSRSSRRDRRARSCLQGAATKTIITIGRLNKAHRCPQAQVDHVNRQDRSARS